MTLLKNIFTSKNAHLGLFLEKDKLKIILLQEESKNFSPISWESLDFDFKNITKEKKIEFFRKLQEKTKQETINISIDENLEAYKEIEKDFYLNAKIAGFKKINLVNWDFNFNHVILNKNTIEPTLFGYFKENDKIDLFYLKNKTIYKKQEVELNTLESLLPEFLNEGFDEFFISGDFENKIDSLKKKFYEKGIKVDIYNPWKNILDFAVAIPGIFKSDMNEYLKALAVALPPLPEIPYYKEKEKKEIKNAEKISSPANTISSKIEKAENENEKVDVDFIMDNKKDDEILKEKYTISGSLKRIFNKVIWGPEECKSFKYYYDKNHFLNKEINFKKNNNEKNIKKKKVFLPKWKKKIFLPKPKQKKEKQNKKVKNKILHKVVLGPKESESFKYLENKDSVLHKEIKINLKEKKEKISKKIFLPKPKKLIKIDKKILHKVVVGPKESESFKYLENKKSILHKKIFLPKLKEVKLLPPAPEKSFLNKLWKFLNQPILFKNEEKEKKDDKK